MSKKNVNEVTSIEKKKTVIQAVKAVAVLVIICLVCCLLLALCNDLLYVSDEVRFERAMKKIYPEFQKKRDVTLEKDKASDASYGKIESVVESTDGTYIIKSTGNGGYGGTVTIYIAVGSDKLIKGISIVEGKGETLLANITDSALRGWYVGKAVDGDLSLSGKKVSGTTLTSTAINNAVNMAAQYCAVLGIIADARGDAQVAVMELLSEIDEGYAAYSLDFYNITEAKIGSTSVQSMLSGAADTISYVFGGNGDKGLVTAFVYGKDENRKIVVETADGYKHSDNVNDTDDFLAKIQAVRVMSFSYTTSAQKTATAYAMITEVAAGGVYTVAGLKVSGMPNTYVLNVTVETVDGKGKVTAIDITTDGWVAGEPTVDSANILATSLVGATSDTVGTIYKQDAVVGASQSANLIAVAVQAALADYDAKLASQN